MSRSTDSTSDLPAAQPLVSKSSQHSTFLIRQASELFFAKPVEHCNAPECRILCRRTLSPLALATMELMRKKYVSEIVVLCCVYIDFFRLFHPGGGVRSGGQWIFTPARGALEVQLPYICSSNHQCLVPSLLHLATTYVLGAILA